MQSSHPTTGGGEASGVFDQALHFVASSASGALVDDAPRVSAASMPVSLAISGPGAASASAPRAGSGLSVLVTVSYLGSSQSYFGSTERISYPAPAAGGVPATNSPIIIRYGYDEKSRCGCFSSCCQGLLGCCKRLFCCRCCP